jgi:hypothetical protein
MMEARTLEELETIVSRSFIDAGNALREIRDRRLYRGHATFEEYCQKRWGWNRDYANKQIRAAGVVQNLDSIVSKPQNEAQARELARLPAEQQREVAATIDFTTTTAAEIRERVQEIETMNTKLKTSKPAGPALATDAATRIERGILEAAALPQPITMLKLCECLGSKAASSRSTRELNRALLMVPWLRLHRLANGKVKVIINRELEEICSRCRRGGKPPMAFCRWLFEEFMRRRKEANLANSKRVWNPDAIAKADLIDILVWVENELQNYLNHGPSGNAREKAQKPPQLGKGNNHDRQSESGTAAIDAGTSTGI